MNFIFERFKSKARQQKKTKKTNSVYSESKKKKKKLRYSSHSAFCVLNTREINQ